jgi:hypothetical protein
VDGPPYELNYICAKPGCTAPSTDPHHLWRRSELIGAHWWVHLPDDDVLVGNVVWLCQMHHHAITVNSAWIRWNEGTFTWTDLINAEQALSFQPPVRQAEDTIQILPEKNGEQPAAEFAPQPDGTCPTCLRPLPHPKSEREPRRERRTWSITVPVDERENGAETLDEQLEAARREMAKAGLPYGDEAAARFFVLSTALGLFVMHAEDVLT